MKRVTFRVPEDHEIATSASVEEVTVTASHGDVGINVHVGKNVGKNGEEYGGYAYGWYPTIDEAQAVAGDYARSQLRRTVILQKTRGLV